MKKIIFSALVIASLSASALASPKRPGMSGAQIENLLIRLQKKIETRNRKLSKLDTKIVKFFLSPGQPKQSENVVVFAQIASRFLDSDTFIEATFDGNAVALEKSAAELWAFDAGSFSEIKEHTFTANVMVQDTAAAAEIKSAILILDSAIASLNAQIDAETNEAIRNQLIAERDQKLAQKAELISALDGLKKSIASETLTFAIQENPAAPGFPRIQSASPKSGPLEGGTLVRVFGENFSAGMTARLGEESVNLTYVSPTEVKFLTPIFSGDGPKDLEIRSAGPNVKNTIRKNAFYAVAHLSPPMSNLKPVALAGASQSVSVGNFTIVSGFASYDPNPGTTLDYSWKAVSVPTGSGITPGVVYATGNGFGFTPSKPGSYIWELVVNDGEFDSDPSLTVVTANPPANGAPNPTAPSISVLANGTRTSQIAAGDADDYQSHAYIITRQASLGTATVSSTGLVSFAAGSSTGSDSIEVAVVDNGSPPLSGSVTIPVTVQASTLQVDSLYAQVRARDGFVTVGMGADVLSTTAPGIKKVVWDFGDGTVSASNSVAPNDGFIEHDYINPGTYTATVTLIDVYDNSKSKSLTFSTGTSNMPVPRLVSNLYAGPAPLTVNFDATQSTDDVGINQYRFRWNDGTPDTTNATGLATHTFNNPGLYRVRLRTRDADNNISFAYLDVYVGNSPSPQMSRPLPWMTVGHREVLVNTPHAFSGANSFDPNPAGGIAAYRWNFNDYFTCGSAHPTPGCVGTGATIDYTYSAAGSFSVSLEVEGALGGVSTEVKNVMAVNAGHAPRAVSGRDRAEGVAPFTLSVDGSYSFDYDGTLNLYQWQFGDPACTNNCGLPNPTGSYTYANPGNYWVGLSVRDNDNNFHSSGFSVIVYPNLKVKKQMEEKMRAAKRKTRLLRDSDDFDRDRERQKNFYAESCAKGSGESCYRAGQMYEEDGNTYAAGNFYEMACSLGYTAACAVKK